MIGKYGFCVVADDCVRSDYETIILLFHDTYSIIMKASYVKIG